MTRRILPNGRDDNREHYTKIFRRFTETKAWLSLSPRAKALYVPIRFEWKGPSANNNGRIRFSVRQAAAYLGCTPNTAAEAFRELQRKGFLVVRKAGSLGVTGSAKGPEYELTELPLPDGGPTSAKQLYKEWGHGRDFGVMKHNANNPRGRNGKEKSHRRLDDDAVIDMRTFRKGPSSTR